MPVALTLKLAACPAVTVWFDGCVVIAGADAAVAGVLPDGTVETTPAQPVRLSAARVKQKRPGAAGRNAGRAE